MAGTFPAGGHRVDYPPGNAATPLGKLFAFPYGTLISERQSGSRAAQTSAPPSDRSSERTITHIPAAVGPVSPPGTGPAGFKNSVERDDAADPVLSLHQLEAVVDRVEGDGVGDERVDVDLAVEVELDELGN